MGEEGESVMPKCTFCDAPCDPDCILCNACYDPELMDTVEIFVDLIIYNVQNGPRDQIPKEMP